MSVRVQGKLSQPEKWEAVIALKVFGDESADERAERVFALGVVIGTEDEWSRAISEWLRITKGDEFHANTFETKRPDEYRQLVTALATSDLVGISVAMDLQGYKAVTPKWEKDSAYSKCFADLLGWISEMTLAWNDRVQAQASTLDDCLRPEITLDRRQGSGTLVELYDAFVDQPEWFGSDILGTKVSFDTRQNPRIQVADMFAREAMKEMDRVVSAPNAPQRPAMLALGAVRKKFQFIQYRREYWEGWEEKRAALADKEGLVVEGYARWLHDTGRVQGGRPADNLKNKFAYLAWLDNRQRITKRQAS